MNGNYVNNAEVLSVVMRLTEGLTADLAAQISAGCPPRCPCRFCRTWPWGCCQTEVQPPADTGGSDDDGVRGHGGQQGYLPHRAGLPGPRPGLRVRPGLQRHRPGG